MIATIVAMLIAAEPGARAAKPSPRPARAVPTTRPAKIILPIVDQAADCAAVPTALGCPGRAQSRYRLPLAEEAAPSSKDRAMAETGEQCQLVGAKMCTSHGRTVLSQPLNNATQQ